MSIRVRLYTPRGVALGALLGSVAAAAVLLWLNYRTLGRPGLANKVAVVALALYLLIVLVASLLPENLLLAAAFVAAQAALAYWAAETLQGEVVRYHLARGAAAHSLPRAGAVGFLAGLSAVGLLLAATSLLGIGAV